MSPRDLLPQGFRIKTVIKRDGREVEFDPGRIWRAISKAMIEVGKYDEGKLRDVVEDVLITLNETFDRPPHVEEIQDIIEITLMKHDLFEVAKAYILYRKERERERKEKMAILGTEKIDKVTKRLSVNAVRLLAARYLLKDPETGKIMETPRDLFVRVASLVVIPDFLYDPKVYDPAGNQPPRSSEIDVEEMEVGGDPEDDLKPPIRWNKNHIERMRDLFERLSQKGHMKKDLAEIVEMIRRGELDHYQDFLRYFRLMADLKFMPNSPTLFNAGTPLGQLSACFVLDIQDSIDSIMKAAWDAAKIFQSGGGIGINYSNLRPEGDVVRSTNGVASGPVSFMRIIDVMTDVIKQGGRRRGANMGILEVWHPDIRKFVEAKATEGRLTNFNISVMLDGEFWEKYEKGEKYPLRNPRDGKVWDELDPREFFEYLAEMAWKTGDPGVLFKDNINRRNVMREFLGEIRATNPCGEEPLYPYESCNLGSMNLYAYIERLDGNAEFRWEEFARDVKTALRFLDNIIDVNKFPLPEIEKNTRATRKVGLGLMGLADTLFALGIPYNSEEGFEFMRKVTEWLTYHAMWESTELARERGTFPLYENSLYPKGEMPVEGYYHREWWTLNWTLLRKRIDEHGIRNAEVTTIAPTGSISMICDTSSGIEPQFALVYEKRVTVGSFFYVDNELKFQMRRRGLYSEKLLKEISDNGGSLQGLDVPEDMKKVFVVAYDIPWWDHVRAQGEINKWICAAVSKTINMPKWVSPKDVEKAYLFAHRLGLKGITVYRDGSKAEQVLVTPSQREGRYVLSIENNTLKIMELMGIELPTMEKKKEPLMVFKVPRTEGKKKTCPVCGSERLVFKEDCVTCLDCGWSECIIS